MSIDEVTSIAFCWIAERSDGAGLALTSHDQAMIVDGMLFQPDPAITQASITRELGLASHASEVSGAMSSDAISAEDLTLGRWDGASLVQIVVSWEAPAEPPNTLLKGSIGEVSISDESFTADLRGAAALLDRPICPLTSPECRAELGDRECRVDLAGRTRRLRVTASAGNSLTLDGAVDDRYSFGRFRFLGGANCGWASAILAIHGNVIRLRDVPRAPVEDGCRIELREGCDKRLETCSQRFANAVNFRGEPHLPGNDLLTRYPGA